MIVMLGAPRSGTTWLAAIFDSHEDLLYRHEPDIVRRRTSIPSPCPRTAIADFSAEARRYLLELATVSQRKTVGPPLLFRKTYRSTANSLIRLGRYGVLRSLAQGWSGADMAIVNDRMADGARPRVLLKSVSGCGRAGLYAEALPEARFVFMMRSPFGQVASMLRGTRLGRLDGARASESTWRWPEAQHYGIEREQFARMPLVERLAWFWALQTEKALDDLSGRTNVRTVCFETLCADPLEAVQSLFTFTGLTLGSQTLRFLDKSTRAPLRSTFYSVFQDTRNATARWRSELSAAEQKIVWSVVEQTRAYPAYRDRLALDGLEADQL